MSQIKPLNVAEYQEEARKVLTHNAYSYYVSGARDEITLRENEDAYKRIFIVPRFLRNVAHVDCSTTVLGEKVSSPILIAASAMHKLATSEGEKATYRASQRCGSIFMLSSLSTTSLEEVATCGVDKRWFQLYIAKDRSFTQRLIKRVEQSGYTALVVTVDTPILGVRERDVRNAFHLPPPLKLANFEEFGGDTSMSGATRQGKEQMSGLQAFFYQNLDPSISWKDIEWIIKQTKLPVLLKGIMSPEDAALAVQCGVAGIIVSNHGARQLDTVPATISVLPGIVAAVQGRVPVYLDGGIRRGTDVLKALALGAKSIFLGRPVLWALAVNGEQGVVDVLTMLKTELEQAMTLAGVRNISEIDKSLLFSPPKL